MPGTNPNQIDKLEFQMKATSVGHHHSVEAVPTLSSHQVVEKINEIIEVLNAMMPLVGFRPYPAYFSWCPLCNQSECQDLENHSGRIVGG